MYTELYIKAATENLKGNQQTIEFKLVSEIKPILKLLAGTIYLGPFYFWRGLSDFSANESCAIIFCKFFIISMTKIQILNAHILLWKVKLGKNQNVFKNLLGPYSSNIA